MGWTQDRHRTVSDFIAVFDEFDAWEFLQICAYRTDKQYCKEVAKLVLEMLAERRLSYGEKVRLHVAVPEYRRIAVAVYGERRSVAVFLHVAVQAAHDVPEGALRPRGVHMLALFYERGGSGGFSLKTADWNTPEIRAMKNLHPSAFFSDGSA
ncbi:MAG: hypothetical protein ACO2PM_14725 [Pyrobaculum sp.]|jgi:hypothetical protein